jgi:hypothetical protein
MRMVLINIKEEVIDMPGGDGTGPKGMGPMTGRGAGFCAGYSVPGYANPMTGRGFGFGRGRGFGRGMGRGFRRRFGGGWGGPYVNLYDGNPYDTNVTPQQESEILKNQAKAMQDEINAINERIVELESASKDNK